MIFKIYRNTHHTVKSLWSTPTLASKSISSVVASFIVVLRIKQSVVVLPVRGVLVQSGHIIFYGSFCHVIVFMHFMQELLNNDMISYSVVCRAFIVKGKTSNVTLYFRSSSILIDSSHRVQ